MVQMILPQHVSLKKWVRVTVSDQCNHHKSKGCLNTNSSIIPVINIFNQRNNYGVKISAQASSQIWLGKLDLDQHDSRGSSPAAQATFKIGLG